MPEALDQVLAKIGNIETSLADFQTKAQEEIKATGVASTETKNALEKLGEQQREVADRLLALEQNGQAGGGDTTAQASMGKQFTGSDAYANFTTGSTSKARFEVSNNTLTGSDAIVAPDRKPGIVPGAMQPLTLESLFPSLPTSSNAIEFTRELAFTNSAAETAEGTQKPESSLTFELLSLPIATVAHWIKISKQLAADAPALAAYINSRMQYGVDRRVETQLGVGDGVSPNIGGILKTGNSVIHTYTAAALGSTLPKLVLIRRLIADAAISGYPADAILMNPADWATIEIELLTTSANQMRVSFNAAGQPMLFGVPVIQSIGITADTLLVGAFQQAGTIHNRQGMMIELSESDGDNFTKNLITIRAEKRLQLAVESPAAILSGDLTPA